MKKLMKKIISFLFLLCVSFVAFCQSNISKNLTVEIKLTKDFKSLVLLGLESCAYPETLEFRGYGSQENHPESLPDFSVTMVKTENDFYVHHVTYYGQADTWTQEFTDFPSWRPVFVMFDINGDGFKDLGMIWSAASNRGIDFNVWNPQKFFFDDSKINLCNPMYSEKKNRIYCYEHMNAAECMETVYEIENGKLNQLFSLHTIYSDENHAEFVLLESDGTETVVEVMTELSSKQKKEKQKQIKNLNKKIAGYLK